MSTQTTDALKQLVRTRLITYVDPDGHTLGDANALGAGVAPGYNATRLYREAAPDNVAVPYAVLAFKSPQLVDGSDGLKMTADVEVMLFGRPRATQAAIEALGDRCVQAFMTWRDATDGIVWVAAAVAQTLPRFSAPADSDLVQVRVVAKLHCYPTLLSRISS